MGLLIDSSVSQPVSPRDESFFIFSGKRDIQKEINLDYCSFSCVPITKEMSYTDENNKDSQETNIDYSKMKPNEILDEIVRNLDVCSRKNNSPRGDPNEIDSRSEICEISISSFSPISMEKIESHRSNESTNNVVFLFAPENVILPNKTESDINKSIDDFRDKGTMPSITMINDVEKQIERLRLSAVYEGDYLKAESYDCLKKKLKNESGSAFSRTVCQSKIAAIKERYEETKKHEEITTKKWEDKIYKARLKYQEKINDLEEKHMYALCDFEEKWNDPAFLRSLSKPSSRLMQLRKIERSHILLKQYKEAKDIQDLANKLEHKETKYNQKRGFQEMNTCREALKAKQQNEKDTLLKKLDHSLSVLIKTRDEQLQIIQKKLKKFEQLMKIMEKEEKSNLMVPQTSPNTPRTTSRFLEFRNSSYLKPLDIKPMKSVSSTPKTKKIFVKTGSLSYK